MIRPQTLIAPWRCISADGDFDALQRVTFLVSVRVPNSVVPAGFQLDTLASQRIELVHPDIRCI